MGKCGLDRLARDFDMWHALVNAVMYSHLYGLYKE